MAWVLSGMASLPSNSTGYSRGQNNIAERVQGQVPPPPPLMSPARVLSCSAVSDFFL